MMQLFGLHKKEKWSRGMEAKVGRKKLFREGKYTQFQTDISSHSGWSFSFVAGLPTRKFFNLNFSFGSISQQDIQLLVGDSVFLLAAPLLYEALAQPGAGYRVVHR